MKTPLRNDFTALGMCDMIISYKYFSSKQIGERDNGE